MGCDGVNNLLGQILNENQRGDKDIGLGNIGAEIGVVVLVAQFLNQIAAEFNTQIGSGGIQSISRLGESVLILGLKNHVNSLHHGFVVLALHRSNASIGGANLCEHQRILSNVKNLTATKRA